MESIFGPVIAQKAVQKSFERMLARKVNGLNVLMCRRAGAGRLPRFSTDNELAEGCGCGLAAGGVRNFAKGRPKAALLARVLSEKKLKIYLTLGADFR
jgi:hypothetical protein